MADACSYSNVYVSPCIGTKIHKSFAMKVVKYKGLVFSCIVLRVAVLRRLFFFNSPERFA